MPNQYTAHPIPIEERFWSKVDRSGGPDACWLWTGSFFDSGYGQFAQTAKINRRAHRVAYELAIGPIPDGLNVLHSCDNRPCCNPSHLFIGTQLDNMADMTAKGRQGMRGHFAPERRPRGERHHNSRLTLADVRAIRLAYASGHRTQQSLANEYGVTRGNIGHIVRGVAWRTEDG